MSTPIIETSTAAVGAAAAAVFGPSTTTSMSAEEKLSTGSNLKTPSEERNESKLKLKFLNQSGWLSFCSHKHFKGCGRHTEDRRLLKTYCQTDKSSLDLWKVNKQPNRFYEICRCLMIL